MPVTNIDVTVVDKVLYRDIHQWHVSLDDTMSDRRQIQFSVKWDKPAAVHCRNVKKTNWEVYEAELDASIGLWFGRIDAQEDIERELDIVNSAIIQSFHKACPERRILL